MNDNNRYTKEELLLLSLAFKILDEKQAIYWRPEEDSLRGEISISKKYDTEEDFNYEILPSFTFTTEYYENNYRKYLVTYLDLLGFKNQIKTAENNADMQAELLVTISRISRNFFKDTIGFDLAKHLWFSDSFTRCTPIIESDIQRSLEATLRRELKLIAQVQLDLFINYDILVRGGISFGEMYCDERKSILFGPPLIEAYRLESQDAKYPRIVLCDKLKEIVENNNIFSTRQTSCCWNYKNTELLRNIYQYIFVSSDDKGEKSIYYVDYLRTILTEYSIFGVEESELFSILNTHKSRILDFYNRNKETESIKEKAEWLINYHNETIVNLYKIRLIDESTMEYLRI